MILITIQDQTAALKEAPVMLLVKVTILSVDTKALNNSETTETNQVAEMIKRQAATE